MEKMAAIIGPERCKDIFGIYPGEDFLTLEPKIDSSHSGRVVSLLLIIIFFFLIVWTLINSLP
jgi:hypothetical protein